MRPLLATRAGFATLFTVALASASLGSAATLPLPPPPTPTATYQSGSLQVAEYGTPAKPPLVLIPGLACGPWVWNAEIARLSAAYHIYALTLPGFDGTKRLLKGPYFDQVAADFWTLVSAKQIDKPILVGHSLGGTLALKLAEQIPGRLRGVVAIDGLPVFPGFDQMPTAQREAIAQQIKVSIAGETHDEFLAAQKQRVLPSMITSQDVITEVAPLAAKSDPGATGEWFSEDVLLDLRPNLPKATLPILELAPYEAAVDGVPPISLTSPDAKQHYYEALLKGAPDVQVVIVPDSRHFIMYDQPQALDKHLDAFIAALKK